MEARRCGGMKRRRRGRTGEALPRRESNRSQCDEMEHTPFLLSPPHDLASHSTISTFDMHAPFFPDTHSARRNEGWISMAINTLLSGIFVRLPMQVHERFDAPSIRRIQTPPHFLHLGHEAIPYHRSTRHTSQCHANWGAKERTTALVDGETSNDQLDESLFAMDGKATRPNRERRSRESRERQQRRSTEQRESGAHRDRE